MAGLFWALLMVCCLGVRGQEAPLPPGLSGVDAVWELTAHFPTEDQSVFLGLGEKMALDENWIAPPGSPDASHDERLVLSYGTRYFTALVLSWKSVATSPQRWTILLSQPEDSSPCQLSLRLRQGSLPEGVKIVLMDTDGKEAFTWDGETGPETVFTFSQLRGTLCLVAGEAYRYQAAVQEIPLQKGWNLVACNLERLESATVEGTPLLDSTSYAAYLPGKAFSRLSSLEGLQAGGALWLHSPQAGAILRFAGKARMGAKAAFPATLPEGGWHFAGLAAEWGEDGAPAAPGENLPEDARRWNPADTAYVKAPGLPALETGYLLP